VSKERIIYIIGRDGGAKRHVLRSGSHLVPVAVGAETKQCRNVAHAIQSVILRDQYQTDFVFDCGRY
jgi:hypothetical protein